MIIKNIKDFGRIYLNSEDEKFKLINIDSYLTFNHVSWKIDKENFSKSCSILPEDNLSPGQTYMKVQCSSIEEYMQVYSYFLSNGWKNRIRWGRDYANRYSFTYWDRYLRKTTQWYTFETFINLFKRSDSNILGFTLNNYDPALVINVKVDYNKLEKFRELLKGLGKFNYKCSWLGLDNSGNYIEEIR